MHYYIRNSFFVDMYKVFLEIFVISMLHKPFFALSFFFSHVVVSVEICFKIVVKDCLFLL